MEKKLASVSLRSTKHRFTFVLFVLFLLSRVLLLRSNVGWENNFHFILEMFAALTDEPNYINGVSSDTFLASSTSSFLGVELFLSPSPPAPAPEPAPAAPEEPCFHSRASLSSLFSFAPSSCCCLRLMSLWNEVNIYLKLFRISCKTPPVHPIVVPIAIVYVWIVSENIYIQITEPIKFLEPW